MDHADVREILELAAAEPRGVERLEAGDTPEGVAVASHLVDCPSCSAEWRRLVELNAKLRAAFAPAASAGTAARAAEPGATGSVADASFAAPPELKARTLRYVRELGREAAPDNVVALAAMERRMSATAATETPATAALPPAVLPPAAVPSAPRPTAMPVAARRRPFGMTRGLGVRLMGLAAALLLFVSLGTFAIVERQQALDAQAAHATLFGLAQAQAELARQPDVQSVILTSADQKATGSLVFSASKGDVVMVADGLARPASGQSMRCWVNTASGHRVLGELTYAGPTAYWWGWPDSGLADIKAGDTFGVSLVSTANGGPGTVLLTGTVSK